MRYHFLKIISLVVALFSLPIVALAHPHNWIDMRIEMRFDSSGKATGLYQSWLFDDYYSISAVEHMDEDGDGKPDASPMADLRKTIFKNLKEYNFFTHVDQGGKSVPTGPVSEGEVAMKGSRLEMVFFIPFDTPRDPRSAPISYRIFDPSYYIEMLHAEAKDAITLSNPPSGCVHRLAPPNPDSKKVVYAASLPVNADGGNELGQFFTEKVTVECK
jgi:ABC-type uncharacterized transport system substrate-binding protein